MAEGHHTHADDEGFHQHPHEHAGVPAHRHPHHHRAEPTLPGHEHVHATSFESLTYIISPLHELDARAKIVAALVLVVGVVTTPPLHVVEFVLLCALLAATAALGNLPIGRLLRRSLIVLPAAVTIALLAPVTKAGGSWNVSAIRAAWSGGGWVLAWGIMSKAWLSACVMLLLAATTRTADLLAGLRRLHIPAVFVMLLSFISRYVTVLGDQLHSLRIALASRAPRPRPRVLLPALGSLSGNLLVRSYERGERVYAAMVSRGYDGTLPAVRRSAITGAGLLLMITAVLAASALALY